MVQWVTHLSGFRWWDIKTVPPYGRASEQDMKKCRERTHNVLYILELQDVISRCVNIVSIWLVYEYSSTRPGWKDSTDFLELYQTPCPAKDFKTENNNSGPAGSNCLLMRFLQSKSISVELLKLSVRMFIQDSGWKVPGDPQQCNTMCKNISVELLELGVHTRLLVKSTRWSTPPQVRLPCLSWHKLKSLRET